jgi:hypothetical protein
MTDAKQIKDAMIIRTRFIHPSSSEDTPVQLFSQTAKST